MDYVNKYDEFSEVDKKLKTILSKMDDIHLKELIFDKKIITKNIKMIKNIVYLIFLCYNLTCNHLGV